MHRILMKGIAISLAAAALCACSEKTAKVPGVDLANLDTSVAPGEDFYAYATGGWQKNHPLKPEYSRYGAFDVLSENNEIRLNDLFKGLTKLKAAPGTDEQKIADLYTMGLDSLRLNAEGADPVKPFLAELESVTDPESFAEASGRLALNGVGSLWHANTEADLMDSDNTILYLGPSGLAMRNRDYYLLPEHAALREGYKAFIEKVFTLLGREDAAAVAEDAYGIEMAIAVPYWSMVEQRDILAMYNPMSCAQIYAAYPDLHLDKYFAALGIQDQDKVIVERPSYFKALNKLVKETDPIKLRHYLESNLMRGACGSISDEFYAASFDFFSRQMAGTQEPKPRWKRAMSVPNHVLGEAVGKMYVTKYFPEKDKEWMLGMVRNIQKSLSDHIAALEWMSDETKALAQEKLASFTVKIGYPDKWKDYSSLDIDPAVSYYENSLRASHWYMEDNLSKLGKPVDRTEWGMTPQTVNAYYNPSTNEICFPAGILQPPFYNPDADDAVNYGAIGVVISHEMTHGFDDQGRLFDKDGNMNIWWSEADAAAFKAKADVLVNQFNEVEVLPGVRANGAATLGENIADQGGLRIAYSAMEDSFGDNRPEPIDGFTPEQRFFLAYANVWAQNITNEEIQRRTLTDVHSIGENRVNVSLRNLDSFFEAFDIKEGDKMWRPESERVIIW